MKATKRKVIVEIVATGTHCLAMCGSPRWWPPHCPFQPRNMTDGEASKAAHDDGAGAFRRWPACIRAEKKAKVRR